MGLTRRSFIQTVTTSTIGLSLLHIFREPSESQEIESIKESDTVNAVSQTEEHDLLSGPEGAAKVIGPGAMLYSSFSKVDRIPPIPIIFLRNGG